MLHYLEHKRIDHTSVKFTLLNVNFISSKNKSDKNDFKFIFSLKKKGGGVSQILDWTYARGGGVIQMRTVCNRGDGGV